MANDSKRKYAVSPIVMGLSNDTLYEPQRTNHFEVQINLSSTGGTAGFDSNSDKYLTLSVTEFSLPNIQTSPVELGYGNQKYKFAGQTEFGGADSLTCIDFIGADIEKIIYNWQCTVFNPHTGQVGWASKYKKSAKVIEYAPDGTCISAWILEGVWPSGVDYGSGMSKDSSDVKKVVVTLSYDNAYKEYDSSTRGTHASAADDLSWKATQKDKNAGGPLTSEGMTE